MSARASTPGRRRRDDRGSSAVEFALLLLPLMLILLGIITYGLMMATRQNLSQAAAEGARAAAVQIDPSKRETAALAAVGASLEASNLTCGSGGLVCDVDLRDCDNDTSADCAYVTVDFAYADNAPIAAPLISEFLPEQLEFTATARVS